MTYRVEVLPVKQFNSLWVRGPILVAVVALIGFSLSRSQDSLDPLNSALGETLSSQLTRDVNDAVGTLKESSTLRGWATSGFTPAEVFQNAYSINAMEAPKALCEVLKDLPSEQLAIFESALKKPEFRGSMTCVQQLTSEISAYWEQQKDKMKISQTADLDPVQVEIRKLPVNAREITSDSLNSGEFTLVFEGGPDADRTPQVLQSLSKAHARALFLFPGQNARDQMKAVQALAHSGQVVGSQGLHNEDLASLPSHTWEAEVIEGDQIMRFITGSNIRFFSFPYSADPTDQSYEPLTSFIENQNMVVVNSDVDSEDWKTYNPNALLKQITYEISHSDKGLITLHDGLEQTALALPGVLKELASRHRKLVVFTR
jgi:peptidoglycan/xylan/chitin deacetylase (PgdA/CDA1 family)